jgi:hypothetical protein
MRAARVPLGLAAACLLACILGLVFDARSTLAGWLAAELFWLSLPLSGLALALVAEVTGREWLAPYEPWMAAAIATLPAVAIGLIPVLAALGLLYPWVGGDRAPSAVFWLAAPFFVVRTLVYLAIWLSLAFATLRSGLRVGQRNAAIGLVLLGFSANFAAIDWAMSLDPHFASSIYGYAAMASLLLGGIAMLLLAGAPGGGIASALGGLCLAMTILWAYLAFMQYLIVWESDLPREIPWYLRRGDGWAGAAALAVIATHLVAFLLLLPGRVRRGGAGLKLACAILVIGRLLDWWWLVVPDVRGAVLSWEAPAAWLAVGGLVVAAFKWRRAAGMDAWPSRRAAHG